MILEVGHISSCSKDIINQNQIEENIFICHMSTKLHYSLIGYTINAGLHFFMKIKYGKCWYTYDGIENQKLKKTSKI